MNKQIILDDLNALIEKNYDAEKGFETARRLAETPGLKAYFQQKSAQRYHFGHELKDIIHDMGGEVKKGGSIIGTLHRYWMSLKDNFQGGNTDDRLINEVERGEKAFIEDYETFLNKHEALPANYRKTLERQRDFVKASLNVIDEFEPA